MISATWLLLPLLLAAALADVSQSSSPNREDISPLGSGSSPTPEQREGKCASGQELCRGDLKYPGQKDLPDCCPGTKCVMKKIKIYPPQYKCK